MSTTFVHSIRVPRLYKESAKTVQKVLAEGASFKSLVFKPNHPNVQGIYALVSETLHHSKELQILLDKTNILVENPRLDPWLTRVLITELLWGKKVLKSEAKPVLTVLGCKEKLQQALTQNLDATLDPCDKKTVKLPRYVRINTLLTSVHEALDAFRDDGWSLIPRCDNYSSHLERVKNLNYDDFIQDFHIPEVFVFSPGTKFYNHLGYLNGKFLLQDKASCLSAFLLDPKPDSEILDMCAAPGMKTTHLAAIIKNKGKIYAVEMNEKRYKTLCDVTTEKNATCIEAINDDALKISPDQYPNVEYILVDPSCSGSGIVDRIEIMRQEQHDLKGRLRKLQNLQSMILGHALRFPNVKRVIYSTCSIYPQENEWVVEEAIRKVGNEFQLVDLKEKLNNEWHNVGSNDYSDHGDRCLYALPEKDSCNGFFVAMFERTIKESDAYGNNGSVEKGKNVQDNPEHKLQMKEKNDADNGLLKESETIENDPLVSKKSKKKKTKLQEDSHSEQKFLEVKSAEEELVQKKKKKYKKSSQDQHSPQDDQMENQSVDDEGDKEERSRKHKKRKKSTETQECPPLEIQNTISEDNDEEAPRRKKKKKRKSAEEDKTVSEKENNADSTKKSKKKSKKRKKELEAEEQ
ncbi:probable 28S rRNA (cytosine-C(5))-methyltransferase [Copidosoma floridanum]|uniref:probable 28S rRNA (cytosine-C(5))-methyltransferase n=1 Tax=Copidosoma floridanum TaxID=29053 RepID=UPI0006C96466|nr:probable 28S rRNA (cytosine-C(5))-methyltransferase [Copidosoma floridanum]XP_014211807.1 probable 28S rRNA (cytosine-C(5))-methyltransferase [Copidosoma floridanum]